MIISLNGKGDLQWVRNGGHEANAPLFGTYASEFPLVAKSQSGKVWVCERYVGNRSFGDWVHYGDAGKWFGDLWALY